MTSKQLDVNPKKGFKYRRFSRFEFRHYSLDVIPARYITEA